MISKLSSFRMLELWAESTLRNKVRPSTDGHMELSFWKVFPLCSFQVYLNNPDAPEGRQETN